MLGHRKLNVEDYLTILKRRWWIIAIPTMIVPLLTFGATYLITPEYVSSSLVLVDQQKVPTDFVKSLATEALDTRLAYINARIVSRTSILPIIDHYNLYADQHLTPDARIDLTKKALHIEAVESDLARNGLPGFKISFTASDPRTAQQVCAEVTSLFTKENVDFRNGQAEDTNSFIQERLDDAKRTLDEQDKKVADFQRQYFGMLPEDEASNQNIMNSLSSRLEATTQTINNLQGNKSVGEQLLAQQLQSVPVASTATAKLPQAHQAELEQLEAQAQDLDAHYQPDYPDVKEVHRKIEELKAEMARDAAAPQVTAPAPTTANHVDSAGVVQLRAQLRGIDVELAQKQKEQEDLKRQIASYEAKVQSSPEVEEQYKLLTRDYETDQATYDSLSRDMKQAQATTDLEHRQEGETFTLVEEANLPPDPIFPKVPAFVFAGVAGGIIVGLLIVALLEYRDTALRTESEIWDFTHLPTLAVIAWSGEAAEAGSAPKRRLKRLFGRKPPDDMLAGAQG